MEDGIISIFLYNEKVYTIYLKNKEVEFGYIKDKSIFNDLNENEIMMMHKVYDQIRVDEKTSIYCGKYRMLDNDFKIYLDKRNMMYSFALEYNNQNYIPSQNHLEYLNNYYNHQSSVFCEEIDSKNGKKKGNRVSNFFKRFVKIGASIVTIMVVSGVALNALPQQTKFELKYHIENFSYQDLKKLNKDYTYDDIVDAIESNVKISEKDKLFLINVLKEEFEENKDYIDIETIINRLKNVEVDYRKTFTYNEQTGEYGVCK